MQIDDAILKAIRIHIDATCDAPTIQDLTAAAGLDITSMRGKLRALCGSGQAIEIVRGRAKHYAPTNWPIPVCVVCHKEFERSRKSKRVTCSRSCAVSLSWKNEGTKEARVNSIKIERRTPEARARATRINNERWSRPGEREKLSKQNRERWADPEQNLKQSVAIAKAQRSPERRKAQSEAISKRWNDPGGREKLVMGRHKVLQDPDTRAKHIAAATQTIQKVNDAKRKAKGKDRG
jgi:hypothetical protein